MLGWDKPCPLVGTGHSWLCATEPRLSFFWRSAPYPQVPSVLPVPPGAVVELALKATPNRGWGCACMRAQRGQSEGCLENRNKRRGAASPSRHQEIWGWCNVQPVFHEVEEAGLRRGSELSREADTLDLLVLRAVFPVFSDSPPCPCPWHPAGPS